MGAKECPKCNGFVFIDAEGDRLCINCGFTLEHGKLSDIVNRKNLGPIGSVRMVSVPKGGYHL